MKHLPINGLVEEIKSNGHLDQTPLDYFYWEYLKSKVYETKSATINELRARIIDVSNSIGQEMLENVLQSIYIRLTHCQAVNGQQFEYLIH